MFMLRWGGYIKLLLHGSAFKFQLFCCHPVSPHHILYILSRISYSNSMTFRGKSCRLIKMAIKCPQDHSCIHIVHDVNRRCHLPHCEPCLKALFHLLTSAKHELIISYEVVQSFHNKLTQIAVLVWKVSFI